ncbi:MAG: acyltransferase family protein [Clostridiales bacterium]|nr:acyltransferase family protein [Candidatus Scatonaster coprocaballi]
MQETTKKLTNRQANYDLLRIICTIAVIIIHVSAPYKDAYTDTKDPYKCHIISTTLYNTLTRFAVPCFMMLSGALLLSNEKNKDYKFFYKKTLVNIGIPTFIFSILYFLYRIAVVSARIFLNGESYRAYVDPVKSLIKGSPYYHMWYLYTLIGVYLFIPVLLRIKEDIGEKTFAIFSWIVFCVSMASGFTSSFLLNWSISKVVCYIGYVLIGYQITRMTHKKGNFKGILCIVFAMLALLFLSYIQYNHTIDLIAEKDEKYSLNGNFSPIVIIASLLIFVGFSFLRMNSKRLVRLSNDTFLIYLFHAGVWNIISNVWFKVNGGKSNPVYTIPLGIIIVFFVSWGLGFIYSKLWEALDKKRGINVKFCKIFKLN